MKNSSSNTMISETLRVTWKFIRRVGYGRTPETYCSYLAENENHKHKLRTVEGTKLFDILAKTIVSKTNRYDYMVFIDGMYHKDKLIYVTNFRKVVTFFK